MSENNQIPRSGWDNMLLCPAFAEAPLPVKCMVLRVYKEHIEHDGIRNGRLIVTDRDFEKFGIRRKDIPEYLKIATALGLLKQTVVGKKNKKASERTASEYALPWLPTYEGKPATNAFLQIETRDEARKIVRGIAKEFAKKPKTAPYRPDEHVTEEPRKDQLAVEKKPAAPAMPEEPTTGDCGMEYSPGMSVGRDPAKPLPRTPSEPPSSDEELRRYGFATSTAILEYEIDRDSRAQGRDNPSPTKTYPEPPTHTAAQIENYKRWMAGEIDDVTFRANHNALGRLK